MRCCLGMGAGSRFLISQSAAVGWGRHPCSRGLLSMVRQDGEPEGLA